METPYFCRRDMQFSAVQSGYVPSISRRGTVKHGRRLRHRG